MPQSLIDHSRQDEACNTEYGVPAQGEDVFCAQPVAPRQILCFCATMKMPLTAKSLLSLHLKFLANVP
jgi:hypothetical protein